MRPPRSLARGLLEVAVAAKDVARSRRRTTLREWTVWLVRTRIDNLQAIGKTRGQVGGQRGTAREGGPEGGEALTMSEERSTFFNGLEGLFEKLPPAAASFASS